MSEETVLGRPSSYDREIAERICDRLSMGEGLLEICSDENMPARSTVYRWLRDPERADFRDMYASAREEQALSLEEEMKVIADDGRNDWMEKFGRDGESTGWVLNGEAVARSKLRLEDRRWRAAKLKPRVYGDKIDVTSGNEPLRNMDDAALDAAIAAKMKALGA